MWKLFILGLFLVTATRAVSPVVNRELETSVVAHDWPSTPQNVLCEAFVYLTDGQEEFLAALDGPAESYEEAMALALRATPLEGTSKLLLQTALTMRAHSPHCEMHRTLARETLLQQGLLHRVKDAFVVVGGKVFVENLDDIPYDALLKVSTEKKSGLLPQESKLFGDGPAVILYANLGSAAFQRLFKKFQKEKIPLVVRHLGVVDYEEDNSKATGTVLQGYGVRLDIRNVEYKVFDDRNTADDQEKEQDIDLNAADLDTPGHFLAGVNITHLGYDRDLLKKVWLVHEQEQLQASIIPPVWRRRQLPLQAATAILQGSQDALVTLQQISQDLPSLASTLVHLQVPEEILEAANSVQEQRVRAGTLLVNGLGMAVDSPSFNVFEVLNRLKEEQAALDNLQTRLGDLLPSYAALEDVQHAWAGGKAFLEDAGDGDDIDPTAVIKSSIRIDVARGWKKGGILYLNDVEKDAQYAAWPTSTQQMIMGMQMGGPPTIRRNMFNVLAVMDPIADSQNAGLNLALQLMQSQYPARLGLLLVDKDHLRDCAIFLASEKNLDDDTGCPVKPMVDVRTKVDELEIVPVSTQAVQRLIVLAQRDMQKQGNLPTYFEYILGSIRQAQGSGIMYSLKDLLEMHGRLYEGLHIMDANEARAAGLKSLLLEDKDEDYLIYGRGLRFAVERGLKPGMSFLNGRPLPIDVMDESMNRIFGEEQNHIVQLIMKGEITDRSPRSIYGFLLKGDNVYQKSHPLLGDSDEGDSYADLKDSPGTEALRAISTDMSKPDAVFVVDGIFDLETPTGISLASKFVSIMEDFKPSPSLGESKIAISYRILPSSKPAAASAICPLLIHSSMLDSSHMTSIFQLWNSEMTLESILAKINISSEARAAVTSDQAEAWCSSYKPVLPDGNAVLANGRILPLEDDSLTHDDIELLLSVEMKRSIAATNLLAPHLDWKGPSAVSTVAQVATFLSFESESKTRGTVDSVLEDTGALRLKYDSSAEDRNTLAPFVTAVIDPVSEGAQRIAPILLMIRDRLKLPVEILLAPPAVLAGDSKSAPLTSYYRFVMDLDSFSATHKPRAYFSNLPSNHVLTLRTDVPEPWNVQQTAALQDSDNLRCDINSGCGDQTGDTEVSSKDQSHLTTVEYGLKNLLIFGQCYEATGAPPNGLQLTIMRHTEMEVDDSSEGGDVEVEMDGAISQSSPTKLDLDSDRLDYSDSLVMKTVGYWQLRADPGVWKLSIAEESQGADMFDMVEGSARSGQLVVDKNSVPKPAKMLVMKDFVSRSELLVVQRKPGVSPQASIIGEEIRDTLHDDDETVHVFSLATGHLYERFLKIMMLSVTKRTSAPVKFWLFENFLSPTFKASAKFMAKRIGCEVEFVTYKWPQWLRGQSEKQRIIWGYKILFLDVLFPLNVKKIIYVDADQVVRGDLKELWDMDLQGAPYGYTPFCSSREETLGYQFWREGFWKTHLRGKPYHISALYVVDLEKFRTHLVGDTLRSIYQQLSADPGSLSNLDQDLPNYAQHSVPIFSLPQEWLWCESWCSDQSKAAAKTIDLCNNPMHKEPKVSMAKRVISGELFEESWVELDAEVERYDQEFQVSAIAS